MRTNPDSPWDLFKITAWALGLCVVGLPWALIGAARAHLRRWARWWE